MVKKKEKEKENRKVFIILGPTSSGKTSLALDLCKRFNGEIISVDSRQVIKHMDIGTGKAPVDSDVLIKKEDMCWVLDGVKIWGYDIANPDEFFSGYDFVVFALEKAKEILNRGKIVFLVGGTGFYIDLFTGDIKPSNVTPDLELRSSLECLSLVDLQKKLEDIDLETFKKIDQKNKVRLIRAIERVMSKDVNTKELPYLKDFDFVSIGLKAPRDVLYKRADLWVDNIWNGGVIEEVKRLCDLGYGSSPKLKGLVYKTVLNYINGDIVDKEAVERIKFDIHAYIRRQQTWFKKKKNILWVDITQDGFREIIYNIVMEEINNG